MRRRRKSNFARQFYRQVDVGPRPSIWPKLGFVSLMIAIGAGVWWLGWSPAWQVTDVVVNGGSAEENAQITSSVDLLGQNIFRLNLGSVEQSLTDRLTVSSYAIVRQLPHRVVIDLQEREPVLVWRTVGRSWLVDGTGRIFRELIDSSVDQPVVIDSANIAVGVGDTVVPMSFLRTVALLKDKIPAIYNQPIQNYEVGETVFDIDVVMTDSRRLRLNILGDVTTQLADLERLAVQKPDLFSRSYIDLRVDRWAYIK